MESDNIRLKTLLLAVSAVVFIEGVSALLFTHINVSPVLATGIIRLIETGLIILIIITEEKGLYAIGLDKPAARKGLLKGLLWSFIFGLAAAAAALIIYLAGVNPFALIHSNLPQKTSELLLLLAVGGIIGPLAEEFFFRGIIYGFCRRWGIPAAVIISTLLFIFAHNSIRIPVTQVTGGIIFAASYEAEKSLMAPLTIHILGNMAIYTLPLFISF